MDRLAALRWREAITGLALLFAVFALADDALQASVRSDLRDDNFVLIENLRDPGQVRLIVFSGQASNATAQLQLSAIQNDYDVALEMTRSPDSRARTRGLTLLSDVNDPLVLDTALILLTDPVAAVREEAFQFVLQHPHADVNGIGALALSDSSPSVRQAAADLIAEQSGE